MHKASSSIPATYKKLYWYSTGETIPSNATFLGKIRTVVDTWDNCDHFGATPDKTHDEFLYEVPQ